VPAGRYRTRLLHVCALSARKNLIGLLRAWTMATSPSDDALLILKLGCYAPGSLAGFRRQMRSLEEALGKPLADAAPVIFMLETLPDASMPALYAAATHYISLSFGEGWDQPMMEAGASGLKLIAPDHSAYREYLTPEIATLLPSREVPVVYDDDPATAALFAGASWWQPDQDAAIAAIRSAIDGRDADIVPARSHILENYTWEKATQRLIGILAELESLRARIPIFSEPPSSMLPASDTMPHGSADRKSPDRS
jgi:glycosyltransferase involved in cell wall biosynthesis